MALSKTFKVEILGDASKATGAFKTAEGSASGLLSKLGGIGKTIKLAAIPVVAFGATSVKAFFDSERASAELQNTLANNPKLAGESAQGFLKLASALQKKTVADDESIASGIAALGNFKLTGDQIRELIPLVVDFARKQGTDVPTAAEQVGKALMGNTRVLKQVGVDFKATGDRGKDFEGVVEGLRSKVGGFAEQEAETAGGKLQVLKNRFNDLQEIVGQKVIGALGFLTEHMNIVIPVLGLFFAAFAIAKIASFATTITTVVIPAIQTMWAALMANPIVALVAAIAVGAVLIIKHWDKIKEGFITAWTAIRDFFTGVWSSLKNAVLTGVQFIIDKWLAMVEWIVKGAAAAFGWVPFLGGKLKAAAKAIEAFRDDVNGALEGIKDKEINVRLKLAKSQAAEQVAKGFPQVAKEILAGRAHGGPVRAGYPYIVGETGRELFVPDRSGRILPNASVERSSGSLPSAIGAAVAAALMPLLGRLSIQVDGRTFGRVVSDSLTREVAMRT